MKFSIIIPVYNVENYIDKCLNSVLEQSYPEFEVIIVNDGSKDGSQKIIEKYEARDARFKGYRKENGGLSDARNFGLKYVTGDYILFLDSDDYWEKDLLQKLYDCIMERKVDMIRFAFQKVDEKGQVLGKIITGDFSDLSMEEAIGIILRGDCVEPAWSYAYRTDFFLGNGFLYPKGYYHEDYGLTPYVLLKAKKISSISYVGLNYVQRSGSIMNSDNYEKTVTKTDHVYTLYCSLREKIGNLDVCEESKKQMMEFMSRVLMDQILFLKGEEKQNFIKKIKEFHLEQYFCQKGIKGIIKKIWAKVHFQSFCNHFYGGIK